MLDRKFYLVQRGFPRGAATCYLVIFPENCKEMKEIGYGLNPSMYINSPKIRSNNVITTKGIDDCRNTFSKFTIVKIAESIDICFTPNLTYLSINSRKNNLLFINQQIGLSQNHFDKNFYLTYFSLPYRIFPFIVRTSGVNTSQKTNTIKIIFHRGNATASVSSFPTLDIRFINRIKTRSLINQTTI